MNLRLTFLPEKLVLHPLSDPVRNLIVEAINKPAKGKVIKTVSAMMHYKAGVGSQEGKFVMKLSSNENPLGPNAEVIKTLRKTYIALERYPEELLRKVKIMLANIYKVNPDNLIIGNGSDELLSVLSHLLLESGDEAIICEHAFLMYRTQILSSKAIPVIVKAKNFRTCTQNIVKAINYRTKVIYLASPANPSGLCLSMRTLAYLQSIIPSRITIVLDLAYADFVTDERYKIQEDKLASNVITVRTFSKLYGLAGLRIG